MPDDRLFHLALGHSEKVNKLSDFERGVWFVYKLASDDFGVMRFSAVTLQDSAGWLEDRSPQMVLRALETLADVGLIQTFEHQGRRYAYQWDWQTWQKITHPRQTKQPAPPAESLANCDGNTLWLFAHHPKGGKLKSWQAPDIEPEHTGRKPVARREDTGRKPVAATGKDRNKSGPMGNGCVSGGVSTTADQVPADAGTAESSEKKPEDPNVQRFIRRFCELYKRHRHGAGYFFVAAKHVPLIRRLIAVYPFDQLEKFAVVLLTTDDEWIEGTDRGIGILSTKASWLAARLAEWEAKHGPVKVAS